MSEESKTDVKNKREVRKAKIYTDCSVTAAYTIDMLHQESMDVLTLVDKMHDSTKKINNNNTEEIEEMLMTQAHTLNVFFHRCLSQVGNTDFVPHVQTFSDLALRAQKQCRNTLVALAEIKHPRRTTFIKQQNNAVNQQVNNKLKIENHEIPANELMEAQNAQRLDTGATITSISTNPQVETMEIGRSKD